MALLGEARAAARNPAAKSRVVVCVRKLGALRAAEAVGFLVDHLTLTGPDEAGVGMAPVPLEESLPSAHALAEIGLPALPALMARVEAAGDDVAVIRCSAIVVNKSMGTHHALAYLRDHLSRVRDEPARRRVSALIVWVDTQERLATY